MSRLTASTDFDRVAEKDRLRFITLFCQQVTTVINGGLDFATNFNAKIVSVAFTQSDTDTLVVHNLNRPVVGYIPIRQTVALSVYNGSGQISDTSFSMTLRSSAIGTVDILIF